MKDRQPTHPGRVKIIPENGSDAFYAVVEMADGATELGDAPTKVNLLKDDTAAMFGLGNTAVPDDVLKIIKTLLTDVQTSVDEKAQIEYGSYAGAGGSSRTLTFAGTPIFVFISGNCQYGSSYSCEASFAFGANWAYGFCPGDSNNKAFALQSSVTWGENSITYTTPANGYVSLDNAASTYRYVAITI